MTELKRCPFCGAEAELVRNSSGSYFARCTNKQCAAKTRLYHENENGARIAWNKRAERTCRIVDNEDGYPSCSECGAHYLCMLDARYCPDCGARVVVDDD